MVNKVSCIYCGKPVGKVKDGEHVIPKALGGALTIKNVCLQCNNSFSDIDRELCCRSPLSLVASQVIDDANIWQSWDLDISSNNLLLEARPVWDRTKLAYKHFLQYPQIIFEPNGPQICGDLNELHEFGFEDFQRVITKTMLKCFQRYKNREKGFIHFEHIEPNKNISHIYRYPPRIFWRHSIYDIAKRLREHNYSSFILRSLSNSDRRYALNAMNNWNYTSCFSKTEIRKGSSVPPIRFYHDPGKVVRALAKIALNIMAAHWPNIPVNHRSFRNVIKIIFDDNLVNDNMLQANGFIYPSDIETIKCSEGGHSFRLMHSDGWWKVFSSFFGGKVGTFISFPGPNNEKWCCANVVAPLFSKEWKVKTSFLIQPLPCHVDWTNILKRIPSLDILNTGSEIHISPPKL
jgi:hypothetical protein